MSPHLSPDERRTRFLILLTAFVCSACGIIYELALIAVGSYLVGSSITQTALVVSVVLSAMGLGALVAKRFLHRPVESFVAVELTLGVIGAASVPLLYASFAWLNIYTPVLLLVVVAIGALVGAEIPLLMTLVQRVREQNAGQAVADLSAADYGGALIGGLAFPFVLLPVFGLVDAAIAAAFLNVIAGIALVGWRLRDWCTRRAKMVIAGGTTAVLVVLVIIAVTASQLQMSARQALYADPIVFTEDSRYQQIVMTQAPLIGLRTPDTRLFLNGDLQFSSADEYRYHESLVHPAMNATRSRVLVLGGGDGLAARELLKYPDVEQVTLVELDPAMIDLGRNNETVRKLNGNSLSDPRMNVVAADAFAWVREHIDTAAEYDVIVVDFPDPDNIDVAKLYSQEMYGMTAQLLAPDGRMIVQSGSPFFAPNAFWCVDETIRSTGLRTTPYHVDVPSFGDWGFVLASGSATVPQLADPAPDLRFLTPQVLAAAQVFPKDRDRRPVDPSTLLDPTVVEYQRTSWAR